MKQQNILHYHESPDSFLIHRPRSEIPGDAVSEGIGYGLLVSLFCDDQEGFNGLLHGAETSMWNGKYYDWRVNIDHTLLASGGATDAEQDIAAALLLADQRVRNGSWENHPPDFYATRARVMLDSMWTNGMIETATPPLFIVRPGYQWGGYHLINPGYFSPAWYRLFQEFDPTHDWQGVIDSCYLLLEKSPGYDKGLVPDWMTAEGTYANPNDLGYNAYGDGKYMFKDGIRILWRIGTDWLWNPSETRALTFLENAVRFIGTIDHADFYQMDGNRLPEEDVWVFDGGARTRPRREHSPLTIGMWMVPLVLLSPENETDHSIRVLESYWTDHKKDGECYWGWDADPTGNHEDIGHNEMYFDQFLSQFGAMTAILIPSKKKNL